jgi:hypothetical protein
VLIIDRGQLEASLLADEDRFIAFIIRHLQRECRDSVRDLDPVSLREMVSNGLVRARSHGLHKPMDLTAFISIMFEIGPNFDEQPDISRALRNPAIPADQRFGFMLGHVSEEAWEEAQRHRRSEAWFPDLLTDEVDRS